MPAFLFSWTLLSVPVNPFAIVILTLVPPDKSDNRNSLPESVRLYGSGTKTQVFPMRFVSVIVLKDPIIPMRRCVSINRFVIDGI